MKEGFTPGAQGVAGAPSGRQRPGRRPTIEEGGDCLGMGVDEGLQNAESIGDEWEGVRVRPKTFGL